MFATEPTIVRLPPNVVESASTFHIKAGSANRAIQLPGTNTKGTFEKTFDPTTENQVRFHACAGALDPKIGCNRFFFSSRRRHTRLQGDWSSDVCSSDLWPTPSPPSW